ncbi:MAG: TM2 domain-containing protein, partial [Eubacterium sp.]|nr:TM2 domain-containing protein [Eubacterium sp.]
LTSPTQTHYFHIPSHTQPPHTKTTFTPHLLCVFFGGLGIHRFYVGKKKSGILYLCTGGLCLIGWIVDIFLISMGQFTDKDGLSLSLSDTEIKLADCINSKLHKKDSSAEMYLGNSPKNEEGLNFKQKIIFAFIVFIVYGAMIFTSDMHLSEPSSEVAKESTDYTEEISSESSEIISTESDAAKTETIEDEYFNIDKFISVYNSIATTPITDTFEININDENGGYYRTEFRLLSFKNAPAKHGVIGSSSIDIVNYYESRSGLRIYVNAENIEILKDTIETFTHIFDSTVEDDEFTTLYDNFESGNGSSFNLGDIGGTYKEYENYYKIMLDVTDIDELNNVSTTELTTAAETTTQESTTEITTQEPTTEAPIVAQTQAVTSDTQSSKTVYITNTGNKYHSEGCRTLKGSKIPISLEDAKAQGYEPCGVCHP